jgi:adenine phosphoribosyltransferase
LEAACKLVEKLGGEVAKISVVMELAGLEGRKKLAGYELESLICYEGK